MAAAVRCSGNKAASMIRLIFLAWAFLVVACVLCIALYEWLTAETPAYKTGGNEDTVTVFDLVHRGRQRDQFFKELTKKGQNPFRKNT